jgi:hypothetical protein
MAFVMGVWEVSVWNRETGSEIMLAMVIASHLRRDICIRLEVQSNVPSADLYVTATRSICRYLVVWLH